MKKCFLELKLTWFDDVIIEMVTSLKICLRQFVLFLMDFHRGNFYHPSHAHSKYINPSKAWPKYS